MNDQYNDAMIKTLVDIFFSLQSLPERICNEMERREGLKKAQRMKELTAEMEFLREHNAQINKMMFGYENVPMDNNNERIQPVEAAEKENPSAKD